MNFIRDKTGAIQPVERDGKVYLVVKDYDQMRKGVGMLLAELMRIKAEGDYDAAKVLISKYGIHFNTAWRDQVVQRYKSLDLPSFWCLIGVQFFVRARNCQVHLAPRLFQQGAIDAFLGQRMMEKESRLGIFR